MVGQIPYLWDRCNIAHDSLLFGRDISSGHNLEKSKIFGNSGATLRVCRDTGRGSRLFCRAKEPMVRRKMRPSWAGRKALAVVGAVAIVVTACGGSGDDGGNGGGGGDGGKGNANAPANLTLWSWTPDTKNEVALFEKAHPKIKVKLVNAGQGTPEYTKLRTALKAGTGAPDVVQIEFQYIPTFTITKDLVDQTAYGAADLKNQFPEWVWKLVSPDGKGVYGIPWDTGPMGLMYRKDIFDKYKIAVPKTWDDFAAAATKLHAAAPGVYLTDFAPQQGGQMVALMAQAGSRPYKVEGDTVTLKVNDAGAKKWAALWTKINREGGVATDADFTDQWYTGLSKGKYATWLSAAWGPIFLQGTAKNTSGKWRIAPLPQWEAGENVSANWGGSTLAVTKQSKFPAQSAELAKWLMTDKTSATMFSTEQFLFPSKNSVLKDPAYVDQKVPFYGGQQVNKQYAEYSDAVGKDFTWSPFQDYVYSQMNETVGKAITSKGDIGEALDALQTKLVAYAKAQGFKVKQ